MLLEGYLPADFNFSPAPTFLPSNPEDLNWLVGWLVQVRLTRI